MFHSERTNLKTSGVLNPLVASYLNKDAALNPFYNQFPDKKGFEQLLGTSPYSTLDRNQLYQILIRQANLVDNTSNLSFQNIEKLKTKNAYTVCTGHQLCLFTGPLYFIYKIFTAINLAEELKKEFPASEFVPVYWMASEDHDFEEVNHFHVFGKKIAWESSQGGAVGDFETSGLKEIHTQVTELFGKTSTTEYLVKLFENAYLRHNDLASATRYLTNELFSEHGLVIVDGNDRGFKEQFRDILKEDIFHSTAFDKVNQSTSKLIQLGHVIQVNPRSINCFYLDKNQRNRIERQNERFEVLNTSISFSNDEMESLIETHPEKISPNVVLRPMYQQRILPNLAYVGGPGELAYWLEFKAMFDHYNILFPVLMPRNFVSVIEKTTKEKMAKLKFECVDFFQSESELIKTFMDKSNAVFELENEQQSITDLYSTIVEKISAVDKTLSGSVSAELQKTQNALLGLIGKANKALKQKSETEINQIKGIKQKLFPNGLPQERYDNFSYFYLKYGPDFMKEVKQHIHPFDHQQVLLIED